MTDTHQGAVGDARKRLTDAQTPATAPNSPRLDPSATGTLNGRETANLGSTLPAVHFALDGEDEPTLWLRTPANPHGDKALVRRSDVGETAWAVIVTAVEEAQEADAATARSDALAAKVERVERLIDDMQRLALPGMTDWDYAEDFRAALEATDAEA